MIAIAVRFVMRLCIFACVLIDSSATQVPAQERKTPKFVQAFVVQNPNKVVPETTIDLGSVLPSEAVDLKVSLFNTTNQEIRYSRTTRACNCTEIAPEFGKIAPGGTIELRVKMKVSDAPTGTRGTGRISFYEGQKLVLTATLDFGFSRWVGFPIRMLTVGVGATAQKAEVVMPIIVGSEVKHDGFSVEVEDLDVDFDYEIDREKGVLRGVVDLKKQSEFSRLYGKLTVVDIDLGQTQSIPLVLERQDAVRVHPRSLRFVQSSVGTRYVANIYARSTKDGSEEDLCRASAKLDDVAFSCVAERLGDSVFKIAVSVDEEQVNSILSSDDYEQRDSRRIQLTVEYGDTIVKSAVPFYFQEQKR